LNLLTLQDAAFTSVMAQRLADALDAADGVAKETLQTVQARASGA
jgi:hypothetical protein